MEKNSSKLYALSQHGNTEYESWNLLFFVQIFLTELIDKTDCAALHFGMFSLSFYECDTDLLIPVPDLPEVIDGQLGLYVLLPVEGYEWHLKHNNQYPKVTYLNTMKDQDKLIRVWKTSVVGYNPEHSSPINLN